MAARSGDALTLTGRGEPRQVRAARVVGGVLRRARRQGRDRADVRAGRGPTRQRPRRSCSATASGPDQFGGRSVDRRPLDHIERRRLHRRRRARARRRVRSRVCRGPGAARARSRARVVRNFHYLSVIARLKPDMSVRACAVRDERHRRAHRRAISRHQEGLGRDRRSPRRSDRRRTDLRRRSMC